MYVLIKNIETRIVGGGGGLTKVFKTNGHNDSEIIIKYRQSK